MPGQPARSWSSSDSTTASSCGAAAPARDDRSHQRERQCQRALPGRRRLAGHCASASRIAWTRATAARSRSDSARRPAGARGAGAAARAARASGRTVGTAGASAAHASSAAAASGRVRRRVAHACIEGWRRGIRRRRRDIGAPVQTQRKCWSTSAYRRARDLNRQKSIG